MDDSTRTKKIAETKEDDDMPMLKRAIKAGALGISKLGDKLGFTQEDKYKGKSKEELQKKAGGGSVKKFAAGGSNFRTGQPLKTAKTTGQPMRYKSGGSVSSRADGCAQRGKTRGKMV